ncbi:type II toxin-antitoxin system HipA family toxin [Haloferula sargassicola]|uniref:Serine/threonine-protein kinase toxin HipA n=1 Tax=Haloferula sargassicola TaxID=490096 RepID=A0ABP9UTT7_9BACT
MPRKPRHTPLRVLLNNKPVGSFLKTYGGSIEFQYAESWLAWENAIPVSLSLPLREDAYRGEPVAAVFDNLLPDAPELRRRVAERVGAESTDAFGLLSAIGRDCVGALQFIPDDAPHEDSTTQMAAEPISESDLEKLLCNLAQAPLGMTKDDGFRISVAGAQEKTALLRHEGQWLKPLGTTPTTHIFKKQMGHLPNGINLTHSVENEYYCLKLLEAFGLPVPEVEIGTFGKAKALIIERFDRKRTSDGRLIRLPQEDFCQALSIPPTRKYQSEGGPDMKACLRLLNGSDTPADDWKCFLKAQVIFWLIGATDGHAKNFSIFLRPGGRFALTPIYDVLTAQPCVDAREIERKHFKLAMSVGKNRHYKISDIRGHHFLQTAEGTGLSKGIVPAVMEEVARHAGTALETVASRISGVVPESIHDSVSKAINTRVRYLSD